MYEARKVCNFLLANFDAVEFDITNLRINKLLFFLQVAALRQMPEGLIRNHFEAWQFGPVIRPVFDAFRSTKRGQLGRLRNTWIMLQVSECPCPSKISARITANSSARSS